jgi:hypothetical protein
MTTILRGWFLTAMIAVIGAQAAASEPETPAIADTGARYLPESMRLEIKITDIDLAGDFELFRGPQFDHVRVNKSIYPPRIALEFRVVDAGDQTIKEGQRQLTDLNYQLRVDYPREDPLRHEKEILRDWLRGELSVLQAGKAG